MSQKLKWGQVALETTKKTSVPEIVNDLARIAKSLERTGDANADQAGIRLIVARLCQLCGISSGSSLNPAVMKAAYAEVVQQVKSEKELEGNAS